MTRFNPLLGVECARADRPASQVRFLVIFLDNSEEPRVVKEDGTLLEYKLLLL